MNFPLCVPGNLQDGAEFALSALPHMSLTKPPSVAAPALSERSARDLIPHGHPNTLWLCPRI